MKRQHGSVYLIGLSAALVLCLAAGTATADDIAWDMVSSTSQNLVSHSTDAPVFTSAGDGFQKYRVGVSPSIPYTLVDDSAGVYLPDVLGIIDSATDFDEFFGVCDTVNGDNSGPLHATWVFDISSAVANLELWIDLAAMGDFELEHTLPYVTSEDSFVWTYQVDSGPVVTALTGVADEDGSMTYTLANGTTQVLDDPLVVNGSALSDVFQTFSTLIPAGSQLTVMLTVTSDGGDEGYVARNILVTDAVLAPSAGEPVPTVSRTGIAAMALLLMAGGVFLIRRLH